jgi:hypothetical protein
VVVAVVAVGDAVPPVEVLVTLMVLVVVPPVGGVLVLVVVSVLVMVPQGVVLADEWQAEVNANEATATPPTTRLTSFRN